MNKNQLKVRSEYNLTDDDLIDYAIENDIKLYRYDYEPITIELHDKRTLWKIDNKNISDDYEIYNIILEEYIEEFEKITKVKVYFQGRSGRHATIELNKYNCLHYIELKTLAEEFEKDFIIAINSL